MTLHIYVHRECPERVTRALKLIFTQLETLMSDVSAIKKLVKDIDDETNAVAAKLDAEQKKIDDLSAQIAAGTPATQEDLDAISAGLQPISDRLKSLGADAKDPIPETV